MAALGTVQTIAGYVCVRQFTARAASAGAALRPVTVLKPLYGDEPLLEQALESFFTQDYPVLQLVFGVPRADDPAAAVVRELCRRHPRVDATLVIDATLHGVNRKIGNLMNMLPRAKHDLLVISDSDMHAAPDYLRHVAQAFRPGIGLVTTIYTGRPSGRGITGALGAAYVNQIFATGAVMARSLGRQDCLGATMALDRATLASVGGLQALAPYIADDGILGRRVLATGQGIAVAATVPATTIGDNGFGALFSHELRWARTIRAMAPRAFLASSVQFPVFWALLAQALAMRHSWPLALVAIAFLARAACGRAVERRLGAVTTPLWLVPLRDLMSIAVMAAAVAGEKVAWRGQVMSTASDRALVQQENGFATRGTLAHNEGLGR